MKTSKVELPADFRRMLTDNGYVYSKVEECYVLVSDVLREPPKLREFYWRNLSWLPQALKEFLASRLETHSEVFLLFQHPGDLKRDPGMYELWPAGYDVAICV